MGRWKNRGGGGRHARRTLKRDFRGKGGGNPKQHFKKDWEDIVKESEKFEKYYKAQGVVPEDQWDEFLEALRRPLPVTFRINGRGRFAEGLKATIDMMCDKPQGQQNIVPKCLTWYPGGLAYSVLASRKDLRRESDLADFHELLKMETDAGSMSRQEAVSMIPPLFLDVKPDHFVLDMCAAPGSKTFQILEMLHIDPQVAPTGVVIANDLEYQRCNLLTHQIKRMCSPNIMVTSHDATMFPLRKKYDDENELRFDRVLCDVPCTGDGTLRKSPDIWSQWCPGNGNAMHIQQLRIALKGSQALKVGGRLVYSTCSLNPIEDEAVVADVIRRTEGAMQLVDVSDQVPELKRMPGMKRWRVFDRNREFVDYEEAKKVRKEGGFKLIVDETFFPDAQSDEMPLERCMRVLPHQQDTGGFFIAVLEKVRELPRLAFPSADHRWEDCDHRPEKGNRRQKREGLNGRGVDGGEKLDKDPAEPTAPKEDSKEASQDDEKSNKGPAETTAPQEEGKTGPRQETTTASEQEQKPDSGEVTTQAAAQEQSKKEDGGELKGQLPKEGEAKDQGNKWGKMTQKFFNGGDFPQIHKGIDPIILLDDHPLVKNVSEFYGMEGFNLGKHLISRMVKDGQVRRVYYTCEAIKDLIKLQADHFLRIQAVGQKLLERHEHKNTVLRCVYRFSSEGLPSVLKYITKRILYVTLSDVLRFLTERSLPLSQSEPPMESATKQEGATPNEATHGGKPEGAPQDPEEKAEEGKDGELEVDDPPPPSAMEMDEESGDKAKGNESGALEKPNPAKGGTKDGDAEPPKPRPAFVTDPSLLQQLEGFEDGGAIVMLRNSEAQALGLPLATEAQGGLAANAPVAVSCWRTRYRLNIMMSKQEALLLATKLKAKAKNLPEGMDVDGGGSRKRPHGKVASDADTQERQEKSMKTGNSAE